MRIKTCMSAFMLFHSTATVTIHYNDVRMSVMASQITSFTIVYSSVISGADQRKHRSSVSLAFVRGIHRLPVNSPHKGPVTRKMFPFDDVIMQISMKACPKHVCKVLHHSKISVWNFPFTNWFELYMLQIKIQKTDIFIVGNVRH